MPLFMDFHKIPGITIEDLKSAHTADIGVEKQYGVKYLQFWVNEEEGTVFCLVEGPDAATCEKVHHTAHGYVACAITKVEPAMYQKLMGENHFVEEGYVQHANRTKDPGYRNILVASIYGITTAKASNDFALLCTPHWARKIIAETINRFKGRDIKWEIDDSLIGIFDESSQAVQCALQIQKALNKRKNANLPDIIFKIGIHVSQPVTKEGDFFIEAIKLTHRLSLTVQDNQILTSALVKKMCKDESLFEDENSIRSLNVAEEEFITKLLGITDANIPQQDFDLDKLSSEIFISRPQLYRKIKALTGLSPIDFVNELRLNKALTLLKQKKANITEIAFETGYNSPSYFSKCFREKYGYKPSLLVKGNLN